MKVTRAQVALIFLVMGISVAALFGVNSRRRAEAARLTCIANLEVIGTGMAAYWEQSNRHWPWMAKLPSSDIHSPAWPGMAIVLGPYIKSSLETFRCPADERRLSADDPLLGRFGAATTYFASEGTSYEWLLADLYAGKPVGKETPSGRRALGGGPADQPIMWDFEPFHGGVDKAGSLNILYADLAVRSDDFQAKRRTLDGR